MTLILNRSSLAAFALLLLILWPISGKSSIDRTADQILGRWRFPGRGSTVDVYRSGDRYFGRIAEVSPTGQKDFGLAKNQLLFINLSFDGKGWSGGELIHPKTGSRFAMEIKLRDPQTADALVYKGFRFLHKEFVMTRQTAL